MPPRAMQTLRRSTAYGWIALLAPEQAKRLSVDDSALAAGLVAHGAEIDAIEPEVTVGRRLKGRPASECVLILLQRSEPVSRHRLLRGVIRVVRSLRVLSIAWLVATRLRTHRYERVRTVRWTRGARIATAANARSRPTSHRFPLVVCVAASRHRAEATSLLTAAVRAAEQATGRSLPIESITIGSSGILLAFAPDSVLRVAVGTAREPLQSQASSLVLLANEPIGERLAARLPTIQARGEVGIAEWSLESRLSGSSPPSPLPHLLLDDCVDFLICLFHTDQDAQPQSLVDQAEVIAAWCPQASAEAVRSLAREADQVLAPLPRGLVHGDFWAGNLLAAHDRLVGVVDWSSAGGGRLPFLDLLHLIVSEPRELARQNLGAAFVNHLLPFLRDGGDDRLREYGRRLGLAPTPHELDALAVAYWIEALGRSIRDPDGGPDEPSARSWLTNNVAPILTAVDLAEVSTRSRDRQPSSM